MNRVSTVIIALILSLFQTYGAEAASHKAVSTSEIVFDTPSGANSDNATNYRSTVNNHYYRVLGGHIFSIGEAFQIQAPYWEGDEHIRYSADIYEMKQNKQVPILQPVSNIPIEMAAKPILRIPYADSIHVFFNGQILKLPNAIETESKPLTDALIISNSSSCCGGGDDTNYYDLKTKKRIFSISYAPSEENREDALPMQKDGQWVLLTLTAQSPTESHPGKNGGRGMVGRRATLRMDLLSADAKSSIGTTVFLPKDLETMCQEGCNFEIEKDDATQDGIDVPPLSDRRIRLISLGGENSIELGALQTSGGLKDATFKCAAELHCQTKPGH